VVAKEVTVRNWWRWTLRGLAMVALIISGVLLALHPGVAVRVGNSTSLASGTLSNVSCHSPFNRLTGLRHQFYTGPPIPKKNPLLAPWAVPACSSATNGREHIVEALGIGAIILIGLSFLPRRRPVVIVPVNPSIL
jgi:hypothetical protein